MTTNFQGFDNRTNDFLFSLQLNNTIPNQAENLIKYKQYITAPLNLLYLDLLEVVNGFDFDFERL